MTEEKLIKNIVDNTTEIEVIEVEGYKIHTYEVEYLERIKGLYGFIYVTTNLINGKMYVGQKRINTSDNWRLYYGSGTIIKYALKKHGKENFDRKIIDIAFNEDELNYLEKYYIKVFNSVKNDMWYNLCYGGIGGRGRVSLEDGLKNKIDEVKTKKKGHKWTDYTRQKHKEYYEKYGYSTAKKVAQYDLDGNFIRIYNSATEAAKDYEANKSQIGHACNGILVTSCGFQWRYCDENGSYPEQIESCREFHDNAQKQHSKKTVKYDLDGNFIAIYNSAKEAAESIGAEKRSVCSVCTGIVNTCYGYQFRYCDENGNYPEKIDAYIPEPQIRTDEYKNKMSKSKSKKVNQYTMDDVFIKTFDSGISTKEIGATPGIVSRCCKGLSKHSGGFKWFYADDPNQPDKTKIILKEE